MATVINNEKGFLIIEAGEEEAMERIGHLGFINYCKKCTKTSDTYYYVSLLDRWLCKNCYKEWYDSQGKDDPENLYVELRNFNIMKKHFKM